MRNPYELMDNVTDDTNFQARSEMALQMMEKMIPKSAIFLGGTGNWEDEYEKCFYLIRNEPNNSLQWAVFSIGWNPNWSQWQWEGWARSRDETTEPMEIALLMLKSAFQSAKIEEREDYKELLRHIEVKVKHSRVRLSVYWPDCWKSIVLTKTEWNEIITQKQLHQLGEDYPYEGENFTTSWHFEGGLDGNITVTYESEEDVLGGGTGFQGRLSDPDVKKEEF